MYFLSDEVRKKASAKTAKQLASNLEVEETNSYVKVSADRLIVTVGKLTGLLTSSLRTPKFFVKEFCYFLMSCHQHCLGINLLVQR